MEGKSYEWPVKATGYKLLGPIGQGSFGLVWKAQNLDANSPHKGKHCAIKIVNMELFEDDSMDDIRKEINIMASCKHPNVINYYCSFVDETDLWLVMPILEAGSLEDVLKKKFKNGIKDEVLIATILREVLKGLQYFHDCGQIHRDIKA